MEFSKIINAYSLVGIILFILKNIYLYTFLPAKEKDNFKLERIMLNVSNILIIIYAIDGIISIFSINSSNTDYALWYMEILKNIETNKLLFVSQLVFLLLIMTNIIFSIIFLKYIKNYKVTRVLFFISLLEIIFSILIFIIYYFTLN